MADRYDVDSDGNMWPHESGYWVEFSEAADRIEALERENVRLRGALVAIIDEYYEEDNGRSLRWEIEAAKEALA